MTKVSHHHLQSDVSTHLYDTLKHKRRDLLFSGIAVHITGVHLSGHDGHSGLSWRCVCVCVCVWLSASWIDSHVSHITSSIWITFKCWQDENRQLPSLTLH
ncbi:uncharacterized protein KZ484_002608 [Pholidichthys leucotaenia]